MRGLQEKHWMYANDLTSSVNTEVVSECVTEHYTQSLSGNSATTRACVVKNGIAALATLAVAMVMCTTPEMGKW